jgi:NAD(P)-dependent dehydrogenase (short-subunit alcohol dehydrogenase family)
MDLNLKDRVAIVTGGGAGIGEAIARSLSAEGCTICILDRNADAANKVASALAQSGTRTRAAAANVADAEAVANEFGQFAADFSRIDILVNAAGLLSTGPAADLPAAEWQKVSDVNLSGVLYCTQAAIPAMRRQRYGRIINIASVAAMRGGGTVGNALYGATKAGVVALTMGFARELGPHGITVNAIAPAIADTAMTRAVLTDEVRTKVLERIPLRRLTTPVDVADLAVFLASARAGFISGAVIPVDGGILTT